jgi:hypothetical protein
VLAALMLSGHVRRGDVIDIALPCPEAWSDTVSWVYTGRGPLMRGVRENVEFLAGTVD